MTRNRLALPAKIVKRYTLDVIRGKLPPIQLAISKAHTTPFPKARSRWKSRYQYRHRSLSRFPDGHLRGGRVRLIAILFDFTFVRSIFAAAYSSQGGHCHDPASLFVLLVFAFVDGYEYLSDFVRDLHHPDKGRQYRELAGIRDDCIPQEADFTNFQQRCGLLFNAVFHVVVEIIAQLGLISGHVLTTDGKLIPTYSRYRGCNYFDEDRCLGLAAPDDLQSLVQQRVDELAAAGNGVLILTAHSANFELMARAVGNSGVAMSAFYRPMRNRLINDFLLAQRSAAGVSSVGRGSALREIVSVLAAGGVVAAPLDQNQGLGRGVFVDFFGRPACTSTMLARLSLASSAPVLPVFASWDSDGLVIDVRPAVHPPLSPADRRQAAVDLTGSYTELVEQQVRSWPEQWNWAHRRWKTRPAAESAAAE